MINHGTDLTYLVVHAFKLYINYIKTIVLEYLIQFSCMIKIISEFILFIS